MAGLGEKGKEKVTASSRLFTPTESMREVQPQGVTAVGARPRSKVHKNFMLPDDLAEALRKFAFDTRQPEVTIVTAALKEYIHGKTGQHFEE